MDTSPVLCEISSITISKTNRPNFYLICALPPRNHFQKLRFHTDFATHVLPRNTKQGIYILRPFGHLIGEWAPMQSNMISPPVWGFQYEKETSVVVIHLLQPWSHNPNVSLPRMVWSAIVPVYPCEPWPWSEMLYLDGTACFSAP